MGADPIRKGDIVRCTEPGVFGVDSGSLYKVDQTDTSGNVWIDGIKYTSEFFELEARQDADVSLYVGLVNSCGAREFYILGVWPDKQTAIDEVSVEVSDGGIWDLAIVERYKLGERAPVGKYPEGDVVFRVKKSYD